MENAFHFLKSSSAATENSARYAERHLACTQNLFGRILLFLLHFYKKHAILEQNLCKQENPPLKKEGRRI